MGWFDNYTDLQKFGMGGALDGIGGALGGLFGGGNAGKDAEKYLGQIPGQIGKYFDPYIGAGHGALDSLKGQYGDLLNNTGDVMNRLGKGYQQSPGFQFALQQALQGAGHGAAAGGMAGSPMHEQENMGLATNLANQDYGNYMNRAMGLYGMGLQGQQGMAGMGLQAGTSMADQIAQMLAAKSKLAYERGAQQNQGLGSLIGGVGSLLPFIL